MWENLQAAVRQAPPSGQVCLRDFLLYLGYRDHFDDPSVLARAYALRSLLTEHVKHVYDGDRIAGSIRGLLGPLDPATMEHAARVVNSYGRNTFATNADHFAPDYAGFLARGIRGVRQAIDDSRLRHGAEQERLLFLEAAEVAIDSLGLMIGQYAEAADRAAERTGSAELRAVADACRAVCWEPPQTFRQALQLVWLTHVAFLYEGRYAMALGRLDQYLYPFYREDVRRGRLTPDEALDLMCHTLYKIGESRLFGGDDVVNICIGGLTPTGEDATNELSDIILEAVCRCNIPGPNLSARIHAHTSPEFLDRCLRVIGTGLGYPALMNDEVNIPALQRHGYSLEDSRDYCMVGCIENFIPGKQPPWSDGRFNVPKYLELALNDGCDMRTGVQLGPHTGPAESLDTMESFMAAFERQAIYGAAEYMALFQNENNRYNRSRYAQPFLSCFCRCCIERARDINDGGALYPSVHGAACMGIATVADSLAALEQIVYRRGRLTAAQLRDALCADFAGAESLRQELLRAPKYGNDDEAVDRYARWYVVFCDRLFSRYRTWDGGAIYIGIASNINSIYAGREVAATPDGRRAGEPLSDAASPMYGMDRSGPTAVIRSVSKPDYRHASCGTVLNQKFGPDLFQSPERRGALLALIRTYFDQGGQEIQINAVGRQTLLQAQEDPESYRSLVVRVSGFSAYYVNLDREVQQDILNRTEHT